MSLDRACTKYRLNPTGFTHPTVSSDRLTELASRFSDVRHAHPPPVLPHRPAQRQAAETLWVCETLSLLQQAAFHLDLFDVDLRNNLDMADRFAEAEIPIQETHSLYTLLASEDDLTDVARVIASCNILQRATSSSTQLTLNNPFESSGSLTGLTSLDSIAPMASRTGQGTAAERMQIMQDEADQHVYTEDGIGNLVQETINAIIPDLPAALDDDVEFATWTTSSHLAFQGSAQPSILLRDLDRPTQEDLALLDRIFAPSLPNEWQVLVNSPGTGKTHLILMQAMRTPMLLFWCTGGDEQGAPGSTDLQNAAQTVYTSSQFRRQDRYEALEGSPLSRNQAVAQTFGCVLLIRLEIQLMLLNTVNKLGLDNSIKQQTFLRRWCVLQTDPHALRLPESGTNDIFATLSNRLISKALPNGGKVDIAFLESVASRICALSHEIHAQLRIMGFTSNKMWTIIDEAGALTQRPYDGSFAAGSADDSSYQPLGTQKHPNARSCLREPCHVWSRILSRGPTGRQFLLSGTGINESEIVKSVQSTGAGKPNAVPMRYANVMAFDDLVAYEAYLAPKIWPDDSPISVVQHNILAGWFDLLRGRYRTSAALVDIVLRAEHHLGRPLFIDELRILGAAWFHYLTNGVTPPGFVDLQKDDRCHYFLVLFKSMGFSTFFDEDRWSRLMHADLTQTLLSFLVRFLVHGPNDASLAFRYTSATTIKLLELGFARIIHPIHPSDGLADEPGLFHNGQKVRVVIDEPVAFWCLIIRLHMSDSFRTVLETQFRQLGQWQPSAAGYVWEPMVAVYLAKEACGLPSKKLSQLFDFRATEHCPQWSKQPAVLLSVDFANRRYTDCHDNGHLGFKCNDPAATRNHLAENPGAPPSSYAFVYLDPHAGPDILAFFRLPNTQKIICVVVQCKYSESLELHSLKNAVETLPPRMWYMENRNHATKEATTTKAGRKTRKALFTAIKETFASSLDLEKDVLMVVAYANGNDGDHHWDEAAKKYGKGLPLATLKDGTFTSLG